MAFKKVIYSVGELLFSVKNGMKHQNIQQVCNIHCNFWEWAWLTVYQILTLDYPNFFWLSERLDFGAGQRGLDNRGWIVIALLIKSNKRLGILLVKEE